MNTLDYSNAAPSPSLWNPYVTSSNPTYYTPPPAPEDITPPKLKLPTLASNQKNLTCSEAFAEFHRKFKTCVLPFYINRPDTIDGADAMALSLVSCLCGSTFKNETLHFQVLEQSNCTWPEYTIQQDQFSIIYNSCSRDSIKGGFNARAIAQTLNLTTVLRDQTLYQPFSGLLTSGLVVRERLQFWFIWIMSIFSILLQSI